jgi:hypothetical protein
MNGVALEALRATLLLMMGECAEALDGKNRKAMSKQYERLHRDLKQLLDPQTTSHEDWISDEDLIGERLSAVADLDVSLQLLIELAAATPWAIVEPKLKPEALEGLRNLRAKRVLWAASKLSGTEQADARFIMEELRRRLPEQGKGRGSHYWPIVAAGTATAILATLAAPPIGAAVGAAMGLSGAAATSAGLAALGGGSLAAGGLGMAGGTALIAGVGTITGAGTASMARRIRPRLSRLLAVIEAEKLTCLVLALDRRSRTGDSESLDRARRYRIKIDEELETLLRRDTSRQSNTNNDASSGEGDGAAIALTAEEKRRITLLRKVQNAVGKATTE